MPPPVDDEQEQPQLKVQIDESAGTVSVAVPRFPCRRDDGRPGRRDSGSSFRQKRQRLWHRVARCGLTLVISYEGVSLHGDELKDAGRRLRERHGRRFEDHCDYVLLADGYKPATVHVFALPYPDEDLDIVTTLFHECDEDPSVRILLDPDELRDALYDACEGLRMYRPDVDLSATSKSGAGEVLDFEVDSVDDGLDLARQLISPHRLQVEQYQPFGKRPRAVGQFRPQIPIHEFRPRST